MRDVQRYCRFGWGGSSELRDEHVHPDLFFRPILFIRVFIRTYFAQPPLGWTIVFIRQSCSSCSSLFIRVFIRECSSLFIRESARKTSLRTSAVWISGCKGSRDCLEVMEPAHTSMVSVYCSTIYFTLSFMWCLHLSTPPSAFVCRYNASAKRTGVLLTGSSFNLENVFHQWLLRTFRMDYDSLNWISDAAAMGYNALVKVTSADILNGLWLTQLNLRRRWNGL